METPNKPVDTGKENEARKTTETTKTNEFNGNGKTEEAGKEVEPFKVTGNWEEQSKTLKAKFSQLTDEDLKFETGKENELLGRIGTRLDKKPGDVASILKGMQHKA